MESLLKHHQNPPLSAKATDQLARIERQVDRLNTLINELLDVSRLAAGRLALEPEPCDLVQVVREVASRFVEQISRSGSRLDLALPDTAVVGEWDGSRLDQVITNLLSNALKFGQGNPIAVTVARHDQTAVLTIQDQGIGIAPEDRDRLFQRFERLVSARQFSGFGLGLWIVRQIIEAMGGSIDVDSELGKGTTFRVKLPLRQQSDSVG